MQDLNAALGKNPSQPSDNAGTGAFVQAVEAEARRRLSAFAAGVSAYQSRSRPPSRLTQPVFWQQGSTRVLDYAPDCDGMPILVVPSLINRAEVLDLMAGRSFMEALVRSGHRPFLVDWGFPGAAEKDFTLTDYIAARLVPVLNAVVEDTARPATVIGYCMGGNLALPLPLLAKGQVARQILMATPWDFSAMPPAVLCMLQAYRPQFEWLFDAAGELPVDVLQAMFAGLDPTLAIRKFDRFASMDGRSAEAKHFVALEDWLNDGVPLVAPVARECLFDWYGANTPGRGNWHVAGQPIIPEEIEIPSLVIVPGQDYIVPPEAALPLTESLPNCETTRQAAGHIGMVAGRNGPAKLYPLVTKWLNQTGE